jgi:hypothetical protein
MATFSPVRVWVPSLTFPKVPSPRVFPRRRKLTWDKLTHYVVTDSPVFGVLTLS